MTPKVNDKNALRKVYLRSRSQSFSKSIHTEIQRKLVDFLLPKTFQHIALYHSIRDEVDVFAILEMLPEKFFYLPRVIGEELEFVHVRASEVLVEGAFGVLEPTGDPVDREILDVIVVPGLAFTKEGGRLGYGGGFYDRFLESQKRQNRMYVGVCQESLLTDELPIETHDQIMDFVITEIGIYEATVDRK